MQISFDKDAREVIKILQEKGNIQSPAEVIMQALGLFDWARCKIEEGYTITAVKNISPVIEVILPFSIKQ